MLNHDYHRIILMIMTHPHCDGDSPKLQAIPSLDQPVSTMIIIIISTTTIVTICIRNAPLNHDYHRIIFMMITHPHCDGDRPKLQAIPSLDLGIQLVGGVAIF